MTYTDIKWFALMAISGIAILFFGFMAQKWSGKRRYNERMINIGEGSFIEKVKTNLMVGIYSALCACSIFALLYCIYGGWIPASDAEMKTRGNVSHNSPPSNEKLITNVKETAPLKEDKINEESNSQTGEKNQETNK